MAVSVTHSASGLLLEPLPNLDIPARRTVSHAYGRLSMPPTHNSVIVSYCQQQFRSTLTLQKPMFESEVNLN
ncbi:hypothetical protein ACN38_g2679 [Penicillium nordicum]|uniref:Uncharacterized protein n=1 Tax=Penicillium nordicum TaxID=229535 RepID=A0A0M8P6U3_9EURO|nr:hypothetical protein ACN38_g2679 [Penicillium nordicum]